MHLRKPWWPGSDIPAAFKERHVTVPTGPGRRGMQSLRAMRFGDRRFHSELRSLTDKPAITAPTDRGRLSPAGRTTPSAADPVDQLPACVSARPETPGDVSRLRSEPRHPPRRGGGRHICVAGDDYELAWLRRACGRVRRGPRRV